MANYMIASILLGLGNFIELISGKLLIWEAERRVDGLQIRLWKLLSAWKPTVLLTVYFVLLLVIVTKSHIWIGKIKNDFLRIVLTVIFLPCTIISILVSIAMAIFWTQVLNVWELQLLAQYFESYPYVYNFIMLTPLWIILPWIITIIVAAFVLSKEDKKEEKEFVLDFDQEQSDEWVPEVGERNL